MEGRGSISIGPNLALPGGIGKRRPGIAVVVFFALALLLLTRVLFLVLGFGFISKLLLGLLRMVRALSFRAFRLLQPPAREKQCA